MCEFRWITSSYVGVTDKNVAKMAKKRVQLAVRRGSYLRPPWTVLAEILGDDSSILGLFCVRISLDCMKICMRYRQKRAKNGQKTRSVSGTPLFLSRPLVDRFG